MNNKKGYSLVYVIGLIALILFLVATLTNYTLQRTYNIHRRIRDERDANEATRQLEVLSMELIDYFNRLDRNISENPNDYTNIFIEEGFFSIRDMVEFMSSDPQFIEIMERYSHYNIDFELMTDLSQANIYSAQFILRSTVGDVTVERPLFVTNLPSFLFFALGSNKDLSLYGGAFVDGDLYVKGNTYLSDETRYVYNEELFSDFAYRPFINAKRSLFTSKPVYYCLYSTDQNCHQISSNSYSRSNFSVVDDLTIPFYQTPPTVRPYQQRFLDVDLDRTFRYYLPKETIPILDATTDLRELLSYRNRGQSVTVQGDLVISDLTMPNFTYQPTFSFNKKSNSTDYEELIWIVVEGDLIIENNRRTPELNIDANFLVYGNVEIRGKVAMNSIIYTKSNTTITNASILPLPRTDQSSPSQLVLLSKGDIQISKIHSFYGQNKDEDRQLLYSDGNYLVEPDLTAFLHTERNFEVYTVASHLVIRGGIFAQGETDTPIKYTSDTYGLMINSHRGDVALKTEGGREVFDLMPPRSSREELDSRFVIQHSQDILYAQPEGLPINGRFNYLFGSYKIIT